jgi:hypothetical protein
MRKTVSISIDLEIYNKLKKIKYETGMPISRMLENALKKEMKEKGLLKPII